MQYLEKQHWSAKENNFFRLCLADLTQPAPLALSLPGEASAIYSLAHADHEDCLLTHKASTVQSSEDVHPTQKKPQTTKPRLVRMQKNPKKTLPVPCYSTEKAMKSGCMKACPFLTGQSVPTSNGTCPMGRNPV